MHIKREGFNLVSCKFTYDELSDVNIDIDKVKSINTDEETKASFIHLILELELANHIVLPPNGDSSRTIAIDADFYVYKNALMAMLFIDKAVDVLDYDSNYEADIRLILEDEDDDGYEYTEEDIDYDDDDDDDTPAVDMRRGLPKAVRKGTGNALFEVLLCFTNMESILDFSNVCSKYNLYEEVDRIYKCDNVYYVHLNFSNKNTTQETISTYYHIALEWGIESCDDYNRISYIKEHGEVIMDKNIVKTLSAL